MIKLIVINLYIYKYVQVRALLNKRANVKVPIRDSNQTPLHVAAQQGYSDIVSLLVQAGADLDYVSIHTCTHTFGS